MNQSTIISNDCWGNSLYKKLNVPYNNLFIGTFICPNQYVNFLEKFPEILKEKLYFKNNLLVANLGEVCDIFFLHYSSQQEIKEKWNRRLARLNFDDCENFIYKIWITNVGAYKSCKNYDYIDVLERFHKLKFKYKISFTDENYNYNHPNNISVCNCSCAISLWNKSTNMNLIKDLFKNSSNIII